MKMKSLLLLLLIALISNKAYCGGDDSLSHEILAGLVTVENKSPNITSSQGSVFMISTDRSCLKCFEDVCKKYDGQQKTINIIVFMKKNLTDMLSKYSYYSQISSCVKNVYFYFTNNVTDPKLLKAINEPSPQLIISDNSSMAYYSYASFLKLF